MLAQIVLFDGFDPLDVIAPYEVLAAAALVADRGFEVELVAAGGPREVPSGLVPLTLRATAALDPRRADLVVVPGALGSLADPGGGEPAEDSIPVLLGRTLTTGLPALLQEALDREGVTVATVCGGSLVLAMAGLIGGRPATTHRMGLGMLTAAGVRALDVRVVDDGDLVTSSSVTSGLDLGLYLLERELGPEVAIAVEGLIAHERRGTVWRATTGRGPAAGVGGHRVASA
ncbi:DJ-1/PfpI family protein [Actinokineospora spheciospongiae]|uniref:DJ-1/PfpI family protein n=1 Tax=Actinokineospora spheciospongiae TaxID=909613 RepID=UPI000D70CE86|nr:DJ-1/PfpI family protein [Actinokineospora spheciospongiae]PWW63091.1 DJ-1/PfpI family protein [Actinokineospora spheciospongiae]